jgi:hypothetical protein
MASGTKTSSVFTGNSLGDSPSAGIKTAKVGHGQTIKSAYPQDNVHGYDLPNTTGGKLGGGDAYLGHSLKGVSAVQDPHKGNRGGM